MAYDIRFGWLGETRRATLSALLTTLVEDWATDWWLTSSAVAVETQPLMDEGSFEKGTVPLLASHDAGSLVIVASGRDFDMTGRHMVGLTNDANNELAQRVGEDAFNDLVARVRQRAGISTLTPPVRAEIPAELGDRRFGAFALSAVIGRLQLRLLLDRRMADRLAPPAASKPVSLESRQSTVQMAPVRVVATMAFGSVDLMQLSDLCVGEVLVGEHALDKAVRVQLEGHGVIANAYLRRSGTQRALMFDGNNTSQERSDHE